MSKYLLFPFLFLISWGVQSFNARVTNLVLQGSTWTNPINIYSSGHTVGTPLLMTDPAGRIHVFWTEIQSDSEETSNQAVIYYMINDGEEWSEPVDILVVNGKLSGSVQGYVDEYGMPLILFGGVNEPLQISKANSQYPTKPQDWSQPVILSQQQLGGSLVVDSDKEIHIVYGDVDGEFRYIRMAENFHISQEKEIGSLPGEEVLRHPASLLVSSDGVMHAVIPSIVPPFEEINSYYTQSRDNGNSWSPFEKITVENSDAFSLVEDQMGWLHVLFVGSRGIGGRFHRYSTDGGNSWSDPIMITLPIDGSGLSGGDLAIDSDGSIHAAIGLMNDSVIAHSYWNRSEWSPWREISGGVSGPSEFMQIEITQGNRIHIVWESNSNSIWYVEGRSSSPDIRLNGLTDTAPDEENLEGASSSSLPLVNNVASVEIAPTTVAVDFEDPTRQMRGVLPPLLFGTVAALLMISIVIGWQVRKRA